MVERVKKNKSVEPINSFAHNNKEKNSNENNLFKNKLKQEMYKQYNDSIQENSKKQEDSKKTIDYSRELINTMHSMKFNGSRGRGKIMKMLEKINSSEEKNETITKRQRKEIIKKYEDGFELGQDEIR